VTIGIRVARITYDCVLRKNKNYMKRCMDYEVEDVKPKITRKEGSE